MSTFIFAKLSRPKPAKKTQKLGYLGFFFVIDVLLSTQCVQIMSASSMLCSFSKSRSKVIAT